ncbi:MAG: hypothetical protein LQ351_005995 [Letrouitia transgressa]|nr:MAG: hypothetical protein LQ351_005995 [Letrouitia transgressa]
MSCPDPRWASWNLGVFVCIRCSGIHRGMGTHISRVKSVDLDAWTDEQMKNILQWGNSRANKYWESKLAPGHVPSEAKIENFIRTKYESKRWVMEGPMPDPASLDADGDDDVPLNVVQEKAKLDRASSQRASSASNPTGPQVSQPAPNVDLFGDVSTPPARPSTTDPPTTRPPPPKATAAPPKQQKPGDSLLGLDFFGGPPSAASDRPSSATSTPGGSAVSSRPDLKQSILSLYSSAPRTQSQRQSQDGFGGLQSPPAQQSSSFGGLDDAFSGLNFSSSTSPPSAQTQPQPKTDPFASFTKPAPQRSSITSPPINSPPPPSATGGGGFFETGTKPATKTSLSSKQPQASPVLQVPNSTNGLGDFSFATNSTPSAKAANTNASQDLFGFSDPIPSSQVEASSKPSKPSEPSSNTNLVFNLSTPSQPPLKSTPLAPVNSTAFSGFSTDDAWGSNDAWASSEPSAASKSDVNDKSKTVPSKSSGFSSWGGANASSGFGSGGGTRGPPKITPDEDFGGWNTAAPEPSAPAASNPPQPQAHSKPASGGFGTSDDLFSNVWQ